MQVTIVGVIVLLVGFVALLTPAIFAVRAGLLFTLLGSGAAFTLPALGGASILAGPLFTGFVVLRALLLRNGFRNILTELHPPRPGFWLFAAVAYGTVAAFLIAPFYYGAIDVFPISRIAAGEAQFSLVALHFTTGNLTQTVYAIGQVFLFAAMIVTVSKIKSTEKILDALVILAFCHVLVSVADIVTFFTKTEFILNWLRTGSYTTWQVSAVAGLKRVSGLFSEASTYAIYGITITGVLFSLVISGYRTIWTKPLLVLSILFLLISTSTTAYVALAVAGLLLLFSALKKLFFYRQTRHLRAVSGLVSVFVLVAVVAVLTTPSLSDKAATLADEMLVSKLHSQSGMSRLELNYVAFEAFLDSGGLGVGLGSARTSSFVLTLLSNLGLVGTAAFIAFLLNVFRAKATVESNSEIEILRRASRWGMFSLLIGASVSLHVFELGPLFYMLAAFAFSAECQARRLVANVRSKELFRVQLPVA